MAFQINHLKVFRVVHVFILFYSTFVLLPFKYLGLESGMWGLLCGIYIANIIIRHLFNQLIFKKILVQTIVN